MFFLRAQIPIESSLLMRGLSVVGRHNLSAFIKVNIFGLESHLSEAKTRAVNVCSKKGSFAYCLSLMVTFWLKTIWEIRKKYRRQRKTKECEFDVRSVLCCAFYRLVNGFLGVEFHVGGFVFECQNGWLDFDLNIKSHLNTISVGHRADSVRRQTTTSPLFPWSDKEHLSPNESFVWAAKMRWPNAIKYSAINALSTGLALAIHFVASPWNWYVEKSNTRHWWEEDGITYEFDFIATALELSTVHRARFVFEIQHQSAGRSHT